MIIDPVEDLLVELDNASKKLLQLPPDRQPEVILQCCDVSRDVRLFAGPPNSRDIESLERIHETMQRVLTAVDASIEKMSKVWGKDLTDKVERYQQNIAMRVGVFADVLEARKVAG